LLSINKHTSSTTIVPSVHHSCTRITVNLDGPSITVMVTRIKESNLKLVKA